MTKCPKCGSEVGVLHRAHRIVLVVTKWDGSDCEEAGHIQTTDNRWGKCANCGLRVLTPEHKG